MRLRKSSFLAVMLGSILMHSSASAQVTRAMQDSSAVETAPTIQLIQATDGPGSTVIGDGGGTTTFDLPPMFGGTFNSSIGYRRTVLEAQPVFVQQLGGGGGGGGTGTGTGTNTNNLVGLKKKGPKKSNFVVNSVGVLVNGSQSFTQRQGFYRIPATGRAMRISNNESPLPQNRIFFTGDYAESINVDVNRRLGNDASVSYVHREVIGLERTFGDGRFSAGFRMPFQGISISSPLYGVGSSDNDIGDLSLISKVLLYGDGGCGLTLSAGVGVTLPTGPDTWGNTNRSEGDLKHGVVVQPYVGYLYRFNERLFVQGFSSVDQPWRSGDVTLLFNDVGVGYVLLSNCDGALTSLTPMAEVRVTTPLNHTHYFSPFDVSGTPDVIEARGGVSATLFKRLQIAIGGSAPVTGPRPYNWDAFTQINFKF